MKTIKTKSGKKITLLSPKEKGQKYADELRNGVRYTNSGRYKTDGKGTVLGLNKVQRSYRSGYLQAREDIGKASAHARKKNKRKSSK